MDGLIIGDAHLTSDNRFLADIAARGVPFVLVSRRAGEHCAVTCDDYLGGELAARHLIEQGHRRIAVVSGEPSPAPAWIEQPALSVTAARPH
ncbi:hypothetical protein AK51_00845 [Serratia nematodiphila DZ0503SBS1]|nr:hypothetical protein AK51_00845 [Serratia nematodiphila DZ0503SBS1]